MPSTSLFLKRKGVGADSCKSPTEPANKSMRYTKSARHTVLQRKIQENPFLTDSEIASMLGVSIHTVRLDRMALGIPDLRERTRMVAERVFSTVRSIGSREVVGELVDVVLGENGVSILETTYDMVLERTGVVRGHYIFAQADSLAMALVDSDAVVTGLANIKFKRPVRVGEKLICKAEVIRKKGNKYVVLATTRSTVGQVFRGKFVLASLDDVSAPSVTKEGSSS